MSISLGDIYLTSVFLYIAVWFGLVQSVKSKLQTEPNHAVE